MIGQELTKAAAKRKSPTKTDVLAKVAQAATTAAADQFTDDQIAMVTLYVATGRSLKSIARSLGAKESWCYAQFRRPDVQRLVGATALTALGLEAGRSIRSLATLRDTTADERLRMQAAIELMDRAGLGNTTSARATGTVHEFTFATPKGVAP